MPLVAELHFYTGTMDSGKSTLALQTNHNHAARGRIGRIFNSQDRAGTATLSSRLGLTHVALEVIEEFEPARRLRRGLVRLVKRLRETNIALDWAQRHLEEQLA